MATGFAAVRVGIVMFVIPFVFAFYPELLLIPAAVLDPTPGNVGLDFLPGHDGEIHVASLAWLIARLALALYLFASALARHDVRRLAVWEIAARMALALALMISIPAIHLAGAVLGVVLIVRQYLPTKKVSMA